MCRSIKVLRNPAQPATEEDVTAAARQFVRKISGYHKPSKANTEAFERAIAEITATSRRLLDAVTVTSATSAGPFPGSAPLPAATPARKTRPRLPESA